MRRVTGIKRAGRKRNVPTMLQFRSAITNGTRLLEDVDGRSAWMRRFRDVTSQHELDLGGQDILSEGQRAIIRRAALLQCWLESTESKIAQADGEASVKTIETYQRTSGALRRLLESLGLHQGRKARDVTPTVRDYVRANYGTVQR
jgi:hypothetical protein